MNIATKESIQKAEQAINNAAVAKDLYYTVGDHSANACYQLREQRTDDIQNHQVNITMPFRSLIKLNKIEIALKESLCDFYPAKNTEELIQELDTCTEKTIDRSCHCIFLREKSHRYFACFL